VDGLWQRSSRSMPAASLVRPGNHSQRELVSLSATTDCPDGADRSDFFRDVVAVDNGAASRRSDGSGRHQLQLRDLVFVNMRQDDQQTANQNGQILLTFVSSYRRLAGVP
jgi:hypothetical protein